MRKIKKTLSVSEISYYNRDGVVQSAMAPQRRHEPGHPLADKDGYVHVAAVDPNAELVEVVETSRQYRNNIEVLETAKSLTLETLRLGR